MFRTARILLIVGLCVAWISLLASGPIGKAAAAENPIPLHVAIEKGLVNVEVLGRGTSTGDSVTVRVKRPAGGANVAVSVEPGTVIKPNVGAVQTMALAGVKYKLVQGKWQKADTIVLNDDAQHTFILEGYCRDIEKPTPSANNSFAVERPDADNAKVLVQAKKLGATVKVTQSAIWIQRSKLSDADLRSRFQVSVEEVDAARQLLASATKPDPAKDVDIKIALDGIRQRADRNPTASFRHGDSAEVAIEGVVLMSRNGSRTLGKLSKGQKLEVMGHVSDGVVVRAELNGRNERGLVKVADVTLVQSANRPLRKLVGKAVEKTVDAVDDLNLEVFDKVHIDLGNQP